MNSTRPDAPFGAQVQALLHSFKSPKAQVRGVSGGRNLSARASIQVVSICGRSLAAGSPRLCSDRPVLGLPRNVRPTALQDKPAAGPIQYPPPREEYSARKGCGRAEWRLRSGFVTAFRRWSEGLVQYRLNRDIQRLVATPQPSGPGDNCGFSSTVREPPGDLRNGETC